MGSARNIGKIQILVYHEKTL